MMLTLQDFVMLAKFIMSRDEPGGSVKIFDQSPHQADYVVIDWPISAQLLEEFNLIRGDGFTSEKPTVPGNYFIRQAKKIRFPSCDIRPGEKFVIEITQSGDELIVKFPGDDRDEKLDDVQGEFSGPLETPA